MHPDKWTGLTLTDGLQISRGLSIVNHAKAVYELSTQASVYVPVAATPRKAPDYLSMYRKHPWHIAGLQVTGIESMLLPTRLKSAGDGTTTTLDHLTMTLTAGHERRIARLAFQAHDTVRAYEGTNGHTTGSDSQVHASTSSALCEMFSESPSSSSHAETYQKFAEVRSLRGQIEKEEDSTQDDSRDRNEDYRRSWSVRSYAT